MIAEYLGKQGMFRALQAFEVKRLISPQEDVEQSGAARSPSKVEARLIKVRIY